VIVILDYEAGNLASVKRALDHLGYRSIITSEPEEAIKGTSLIFPGVGAAGEAMKCLRRKGLDHVLKEFYFSGRPMLGICLGIQLIFEESEEDGAEGLGLLKGKVVRFPEPLFGTQGQRLKVPHMGWNAVRKVKDHPLLEGIEEGQEFFFVHAYYPVPESGEVTIGITEYGVEFCSVIAHLNLLAVQFHPEKSGRPGLRILDNFCRISSKC
jgi:glutamine amidotransferase